MIVLDYDKNSDVLYIAKNKPCRAYSDEQADGLLFRFSYETNAPCGVTVFDYQNHWHSNLEKLSKRVAEFLRAEPSEVQRQIARQLHANH